MRKYLKNCTLAIIGAVLLTLTVELGFAQVSAKGDTEQSPGTNRWTLVNSCNERVRVAILADGLVSGWTYLDPGEMTFYSNKDTTVGIYALIGDQGSWWAPGWLRGVDLPVNMGNSFRYNIDATPTGMTSRRFALYDILARDGRVAICEQ